MANSKLLTQLKDLAYDMMDNNGNFRTVPIGTVGKRNLPDDRLQLLRSIISLLKDTDIITNETRLYLFNETATIKWVNKKFNELAAEAGKEPIPYNTTASKISYDRTKLEKCFGESILSDIILRTNNSDAIKVHIGNVAKAFARYSKQNDDEIRSNVMLKLDSSILCSELSDEKFGQFISVISPYTKQHMEKIAKNIDEDALGYFNYIITTPVLTDEDKSRLQTIKILLGLVDADDEMVTELPEIDSDSEDSEENTENKKELNKSNKEDTDEIDPDDIEIE